MTRRIRTVALAGLVVLMFSVTFEATGGGPGGGAETCVVDSVGRSALPLKGVLAVQAQDAYDTAQDPPEPFIGGQSATAFTLRSAVAFARCGQSWKLILGQDAPQSTAERSADRVRDAPGRDAEDGLSKRAEARSWRPLSATPNDASSSRCSRSLLPTGNLLSGKRSIRFVQGRLEPGGRHPVCRAT